MAQFRVDTLSEGGTVTSASGFEGNQAETGKSIQIVPVPGVASVIVNMDALFGGALILYASHDGVVWAVINAGIVASGPYEITAPYNYVRMECDGLGAGANFATATILWVYD